ncbi:YqzL family protein [Aneurinibacillus migulanus]|uniref:YqzL-like protein n=1 Tax=Aneurinibacillus migulanus TaxID=47500 RepID=A0A1G8MNI3_ANEMI|nr:YqzL family protein [Aneurinibacillus migulanus]MCP1355973.1 YqzL family protein [Aneurinibacillus migulanus]MED0893615.1 YqzL family protein [Aneurinibacillus migulanus]MED1617881.1 YqzL family protein [Aneurinibacillus migulanus]MED4728506.1 YqzL family protein [Aneurinibacillus migulanus]SDI69416.1 YqzL-like protein [Aneurinibacillus migulanus]
MIKEFFWHYFAQTGSIDAYLLYTEHEDALFPEEGLDFESTVAEEPSNMK